MFDLFFSPVVAQNDAEPGNLTGILIIVLIPVVISFIFIIFILYRQKREAYFREVKLQFQLDKADLEMRALRAQVNPHFIFNSLISIQHFMHTNEVILAETYLVKFSRLIRQVLENSTLPMVALEDDLSALELYIQMEQLRLKHSFDYHIALEDIDDSTMLIPPLIIQPFVENAIWHGLSNVQNKGHLNVSLSMKNNQLLCEIEDNGEVIEVKRQHEYKKKSMGLDLIERRLQILGSLHNSEYDFQINNKEGSNGKKVQLALPFEYQE